MFTTQASSLYSLTVVNGSDHNPNGRQNTSIYHFGDNQNAFQQTLNSLTNNENNSQSPNQNNNISINNTQIFTSVSNVVNVQASPTIINNYGTINNFSNPSFSPNTASFLPAGLTNLGSANISDIASFNPDQNIRDNINAEEGLTNRQKRIISRFAIQLRKADGNLNEQDSNVLDLITRMVKGNNEAGIRPEIDRSEIKEHRFELRQARREFKSIDVNDPDYENKLKNYKNLLTDMMSLKLFGNKLQEAHNMSLQNEKFEAIDQDISTVFHNYTLPLATLDNNPLADQISLIKDRINDIDLSNGGVYTAPGISVTRVVNNYTLPQDQNNTTPLGSNIISNYLNTDYITNSINNNINSINLS